MALTEITTYPGSIGTMEMARGDIGSATDSLTKRLNSIELPDKGSAVGVYPSEGDVDSGVVFGPNGNDYTGNLVQPAEADVKVGVGYGSNGTEFEGELAGGGGNIFVISD